MKKQILMLLIILSGAVIVFSQNSPPVLITGKVTDDKNEPLAKASVRVKQGKTGVLTDDEGKFRISVTSLPITLEVSSAESETMEVNVTGTNEVTIVLQASEKTLEPLIIAGGDRRLRGGKFGQLATVEIIPPREMINSPLSPYNNLQIKKGVYGTTSGLLFNTYSTRGFNGSGSTRVNQRIDGMDNQAPGLNFPIGNFVSNGDLDIESIELLPGASSALYGPGGMNGTILINSKSPFNPKYQGLSVMIKPGIMHLGKKSPRENAAMYNDYSFRYAKNFNNRFAFKIGAQYISADDWLAGDTSNYLRSGNEGKLIPGTRMTDPNYDGVNVYGDETSVNIHDVARLMELIGILPPGASSLVPDQNVSRTGYHERDIIDPKTKNIKLNGALHYKLNDKMEAILTGHWATGNTVFTDENRYALKAIKLGQYKFELKHKNWFLRTYTTQENAGEAYSATIATQYFNEAWKQSQQWYPEYIGAFLNAKGGGATDAQAHIIARGYADIGRPEAGSAQFKQIFDQVRKTPIPNGGLFKEKSQLWMTEGQYSFGDAEKNAELIIGGNYKRYILDSDGTLFIDTINAIGINEWGGYAQITRKLFDKKLTLTAAGRFDKNENFKAQFTPRFAALVSMTDDHNLRMSYQTAYRFPSNTAQWIRLDVGDYILLGGLPWVWDYMHADKEPVYQIGGSSAPYKYKEFKPETMRSLEVGYKGRVQNRLLIDAYAYFGKYEDFTGRIGLYQPGTDKIYSITVNSDKSVKTHGFGLGIDYLLGKNKNSSLFFNVNSDVITGVPAGFKAYFNTPKYRLNAGFANSGSGKDDRISFSAMLRWQDAFQWEGELANGPVNAFTTVDAQISYWFPKAKTKLRLGGINILNHYYKNGYANPSIGGLYYASFIYNL